MDNTEQYIKMSDEAWRLQEDYIPSQGDYAVRACEYPNYRVGLVSWNRDRGVETLRWRLLDEEDGITLKESGGYLQQLIPLYRQDQLQAMVGKHWADTYFEFCDMVGDDVYPYGRIFYSWEQLWLVFIMRKLYGKLWDVDKEEWVEEIPT